MSVESLTNGPLVKDLLAQHKDEVAKLATLAKDDVEKAGDIRTKVDDLFFLRFILSYKGSAEKALPKVKRCLQWRKENLEVLKRYAENNPDKSMMLMDHFQTAAYLKPIGKYLCPIFIVRTGKTDARAYMKRTTRKDVVLLLLCSNEMGFQMCDKLTRETGRMVKLIKIVDMANTSLWHSDRSFAKCLAESANDSSELFPQLLGKSVLINVPTALRIVINLVNKLQNKRAVEKQAVCPAKDTHARTDIARCPFLQKLAVDKSEIPSFLGGDLVDIPDTLQHIDERPGIHSWEIPPLQSRSVELCLDTGGSARCEVLVMSEKHSASVTVVVKEEGATAAKQEIIGQAVKFEDVVVPFPIATMSAKGTVHVKCTNPSDKVPCKVQVFLREHNIKTSNDTLGTDTPPQKKEAKQQGQEQNAITYNTPTPPPQ